MSESEIIEFVEGNAETLDDWLKLMAFGSKTFEANPALAMEMVVREAERRRIDCPQTWKISDVAMELVRRLNWCIQLDVIVEH